MMPPKKSPVARAEVEKIASQDVTPPENGEEKKEVNIFKPQIMEGKRSHTAPDGKLLLFQKWVTGHLEEKENMSPRISEVHKLYLESCIAGNTYGLELAVFIRKVKGMFPTGFTIKEDSPYFGVVKVKPKKAVDPDKGKGKGDGEVKLKMRSVVEEVLKALGNPENGVRFSLLKNKLDALYPSLMLSAKPRRLVASLESGVHYGFLELVKGIGKCGYYRLSGQEATETKKDAKEGTENDEDKDAAEGSDDAEKAEGDDKKADEEADGEEGAKKDKETDEDGEAKKEKKAKRKSSPAKRAAKRTAQKASYSHIIHGEPKLLEDTFPMAMTYMSDPKEASTTRIKQYLLKHYNKNLTPDKFADVMSKGSEKGFWQQVTGSGPNSGSYLLTLAEFDPTDDKDLLGMVVNAIMASHSPKNCSSMLLKRYVVEFHPKFNLVERPDRFKSAVERAINKNMIKRLSGIGSTGSLQLTSSFIPNPLVLSGLDTASDYDTDGELEEKDSAEDMEVQFADGFKLSQFEDAYKPRPSKRRGKARAVAAGRPAPPPPPQAPPRKAVTKIKRSYTEVASDSDADSESEDEKPTKMRKKAPVKAKKPAPKKAPTKKAPAKKAPAKKTPAKKTPVKTPNKEEYVSSSEDEEESPPPKAKPSPKKAGKGKKKAPARAIKVATAAARGRKGPPARQTKVSEHEDSSSDDESVEVPASKSPASKSPARKTPTPQARKSPARSSRPSRLQEDSDSSDDNATPTKKTKAPARKSPARASRPNQMGEDDSSDDDDDVVAPTPPPSKRPKPSPGGSAKKKKGGKRRR